MSEECDEDLSCWLRQAPEDWDDDYKSIWARFQASRAEIRRLRKRAERAERERDEARQQAQTHAQEARTQRATANEMLQAATEATGEPGDWHGAQPVIDALARLRERAEQAEAERYHLAILARRLLVHTFPWGGLEGFDLQDMLEEIGLLEPATITEIPCQEGGCNCQEVDAEPGDTCYRPPEWVQRLIEAAPDAPATSQG